MILLQNSIVTLHYNPATDILEVQYPDLHGFLLPEIKHTINLMMDVIRNYDVKRLLLDSTRTVISVTEEESRDVATYLAAGIMTTRVEKVARVQSGSKKVEETASNNIRHIQQSTTLPFQLRNFTEYHAAIAWLASDTAAPHN
ncbi:MAG TPA: hypothetical protein VIG72_03435 [Pontibacter sp.]